GSTLRQIILTLDPARACGKDTLFFAICKAFFLEKDKISPFPPLSGSLITQTPAAPFNDIHPTHPTLQSIIGLFTLFLYPFQRRDNN
ncbi:MAG: hypothetical protein IIX58_02295, partial [Alistipes sp.]|nr:hypothetical protein [Alistipes sp.]